MKRINGIIGSSLAGFVALTMAAITSTTTTEAIAFQATGAKVRVAPPTHMKSGSYRNRVPHSITKIPGATLSAHRRLDLSGSRTQDDSHLPHLPDVPHWPTPPHMQPDISVMGEIRVPTDHSLPETKFRAKRRKGPKYFDSKMQHILDDFNRMRNFWEFPNAIPPEVDKGKIGIGPTTEPPGDPDGILSWCRTQNKSDLSLWPQYWDAGASNKANNWGGSNSPITRIYGISSSNWNHRDSQKGGGKDGGKTTGESKTNDDSTEVKTNETSNEKIKDTGTVEEVVNKEKDNSNGGEGDDGNDPDEIRNAVRNENLNISGLKEEAATGEGSGSGHKVTHGSSPQKTNGSGWFRNHHGADGPTGANAGVEDGGPAEMANPMGAGAAGINLSRGKAMSPTVDGQQSGNGPSGPIGPVATQVQSKALSVNMSGQLNAAMAKPMGSPPVDEFGKGGNGGGNGDPR